MNKTSIFKLSDLADQKREFAIFGGVDLVVDGFDGEAHG